MSIMRSERFAAILLIAAAGLALVLANSPAGSVLVSIRDRQLPVPWLGVDLSVGGWVKDGLLAIFFFLAAIELRHELTSGELDSPRKALVPTIAAVGGVIVPAVIFLLVAHDPQLAAGWPIPTATDVAFALGVLAIVGRSLPARIRALLLALAVIDDLIAIVIIAAFFTADLNPLPLLTAVPVVLVFGWLSIRLGTQEGRRSVPLVAALLPLGLLTWLLVFYSGIHPTIAGVALGLIMAPRGAARVRTTLEPLSNGIVLPLFAFVAALVVIPQVGVGDLSPVFWAIVIALPVGKLIGITAGGAIASALSPHGSGKIPFGDLLVVAGLGGIGFTVSLLMNELAYEGDRAIAVEGTLAVLVASVVSVAIGGVIGAVRSAHYRRQVAS